MIADTRFPEHVEKQIAAELAQYYKFNRLAIEETAWVPTVVVVPALRAMFGGRERVTEEEFELVMRRRLKREREEHFAARKREPRRQELEKIAAKVEHEAGGPEWVDADRLRERLEMAMWRMLEEEEEDLEFVRRELTPMSDEREARAKARREKAEAEARARREEAKARRAEARRKEELALLREMAMTPEERQAEEIARVWAAIDAEQQRYEEELEKWYNGEIDEEPSMFW